MAKPKSGKEFEELVTWIQQCLHERATITPNDKIPDIHSKRKRQIDIAVRIKDGPTDFLGIVEIRDRSRPVGEDYIEHVNSKRESVGADAAFIVSSSGFCTTAITKARALNIRIFTHKEALASDWMQCLALRDITQYVQRWDKIVVTFLDPLTNRIISPHATIAEAVRKDMKALVLTSESGEPKSSILDIASAAVNQHSEGFFGGISAIDRIRRGHFVNVIIPPNETPLFIRDVSGALRKVERFFLEADFWREARQIPVVLSKYSNAGTGEALAEVASATIEAWGGTHKLQFIAKALGEEGSKLMIRLQKDDDRNTSSK